MRSRAHTVGRTDTEGGTATVTVPIGNSSLISPAALDLIPDSGLRVVVSCLCTPGWTTTPAWQA